ncbi:MAG: glycosyltransferase family 39 protein [Bacteroidota bacterium]
MGEPKTTFLRTIALIVFAVAIYFPLFYDLDYLTVRLWDESRQAINALEMYNNHNWIVTYFDGRPDLWNTKPPLLIWMQVFFFHVVGLNELALRLPSAFGGVLICIALVYFCDKHLKNLWLGILSGIILVTFDGFINYHVSRTGDYDALLTGFVALFLVSFYGYLQSDCTKKILLYSFFIFLALAFLTKGIAGLFFAPALLVMSIAMKKFRKLITSIHFWSGLGIFLFITVGYYFLRESLNPGYLKAVYINELGGRYLSAVEEHQHETLYYFNSWIEYKLKDWYWLIIPGIIAGIFFMGKEIQLFSIYFLLCGITFFSVISSSKTKLNWYDAPLYPIIAFFCACIFIKFFDLLNNLQKTKRLLITAACVVLVLTYPAYRYVMIIDKVNTPEESDEALKYYQISYYLMDKLKNGDLLNHKVILTNDYTPHITFYTKVCNIKGSDLNAKNYREAKKGETVIADLPEVIDFIKNNFEYTEIGNYSNAVYTFQLR